MWPRRGPCKEDNVSRQASKLAFARTAAPLDNVSAVLVRGAWSGHVCTSRFPYLTTSSNHKVRDVTKTEKASTRVSFHSSSGRIVQNSATLVHHLKSSFFACWHDSHIK